MQSILSGQLLALALLASLSGCASFDFAAVDPAAVTTGPPADAAAVGSSAQQATAATIRVDLVAHGKKPRTVEVPLEESMHVQDALVKSGAVKRFRRMDVHVVRQGADGHPLRMGVTYDFTERCVPPGFDYALRPGDRVVAVEDPSGLFEDMLQSIGGPMLPSRL